MSASKKRRRIKYKPQSSDLQTLFVEANKLFAIGEFLKSFDVYEFIVDNFPQAAIPVLADLYDKYQQLPNKDRYSLYQARLFDFGIKPGEKVLDVGSGHKPFPFATHLSDISTSDDKYGRAGVPFKYVEGKPVFEFNVEKIPFENKEFDFVYCSHVLEHVENPEKACAELQRVAKRGYIETPTKGKDIWLNSGKISNHRWFVEDINEKLLFVEYDYEEDESFGSDILMNMHVAPQTEREKAYSALLYLKPHSINTMFYWENEFECEVIRKKEYFAITKNIEENASKPKIVLKNQGENDVKKLRFMQVHTFYDRYLKRFYEINKSLQTAPFDIQIEKLIEDGFSGNHIFPPYMKKLGYETKFVVANNPFSQNAWMHENKYTLANANNWVKEITKAQIEEFKPDVLYLSDPITFDGKFVASLNFKPRLVIGWRAADIPDGTTFHGFDIFLSGFHGVGEEALSLGAKEFEFFFPGFPTHILPALENIEVKYDLSFVGSWTTFQHKNRNHLIEVISDFAQREKIFKPIFHLSGELDKILEKVKPFLGEPRFGLEMYRALKTGKIIFDARGDIRNLRNVKDLAKNETINMRIFEATGVGRMLLTEHYDNLYRFFEIGKEIETFKNEKELLDKIVYYSTHDYEREEIAKRGNEKCLTQYSMEKRAEVFDQIIKERLQTKNQANSINVEIDYSKKIEEISGLIKSGKIDKAFKQIIELKSKKKPIRNLDLLRAFCFIFKDDLTSAKESLLEELARFPDNDLAKDTLKNVNEQLSTEIKGDDEFAELFKKISAYTMLSVERLKSLYDNAKKICIEDLPGNFVECGVARGGSSILLASVIKKYSKRERFLFSLDTFEGMPEPGEDDKHQGIGADETGWGTGTCDGGIENFNKLINEFGLEKIIHPVQGLFQNTLPKIKNEIGEIALLHLDGDWYESTKTVLNNLYDSVIENGFIQIDDYGYWEGCRKAVDEFQLERNLKFDLKKIDATGVSFTKSNSQKIIVENKKVLLNLGCGGNFRDGWINIDINSPYPEVKNYDLRKGIPFDNETADFIYSSHMLEHLSKSDAEKFISECYRVLKKDGILRLAVPDLETIAREYLTNLEEAKQGNEIAKKKYEWIILELLDQMVRNVSGGEMLKYWAQEDIPAYDYVIQRVGSEAKRAIEQIRKNGYVPQKEPEEPCEIGKFRLSGEIHQWMYDEYSLSELLKKAGFRIVKRTTAEKSMLPEFNNYLLDIDENGEIRKPDSLFMEAAK